MNLCTQNALHTTLRKEVLLAFDRRTFRIQAKYISMDMTFRVKAMSKLFHWTSHYLRRCFALNNITNLGPFHNHPKYTLIDSIIIQNSSIGRAICHAKFVYWCTVLRSHALPSNRSGAFVQTIKKVLIIFLLLGIIFSCHDLQEKTFAKVTRKDWVISLVIGCHIESESQ